MGTITSRSRQVQRIIALESRARRMLTRYERALARAVRAKEQAHVLFDEAYGIECAFTDAELADLYRARGEATPAPASPGSARPDHSPTTTPR